MAKLYNIYENSIDRTWYDSSHVLYSECDDVENGLKILDVVFKNGKKYRYFDVNVNDYLLFRESQSQGKGLMKYIKKYRAECIDTVDTNLIVEEYYNNTAQEEFSESGGTFNYFVEINEPKETCTVYCEGNVVDEFNTNDNSTNLLTKLSKSLKVKYNIIEN